MAWGQRRFDLAARPFDLVPFVALTLWRGWSLAMIVGRRPGIVGRESRAQLNLERWSQRTTSAQGLLVSFSMQVGTREARHRQNAAADSALCLRKRKGPSRVHNGAATFFCQRLRPPGVPNPDG